MRTFEFAEPMARKTAEAEFFCPAHAWPAYLKNVAIGAPEPLSRSLAHARAPFLQRDSVPWRTPTASLRSRIFHPPVRTGALPPEGLTYRPRHPDGVETFTDPRVMPRGSEGDRAARTASAFFPEAEAERLALGPRLPHQRRHPLTVDEACAGIILLAVITAALGYLMSVCL